MYKDKKIIAIAPCYNEEVKIALVVQRVISSGYADEMVVVDDGSTDNSARVAEAAGAKVIKLPRMMGVGAALREGMQYAQSHADIIVILAGNNKDEPKEMGRLLDPIVDGTADFVQGSRFLGGGGYGGDMPFYRKIATRLHPMLFSLVTGRRVTESTNGFRAFKKEILRNPEIRLNQSWLDTYELEPYLYYKVITLGYRTAEAPVTKIYPPKNVGYTKMRPFVDWWNILKPLVFLKLGVRS